MIKKFIVTIEVGGRGISGQKVADALAEGLEGDSQYWRDRLMMVKVEKFKEELYDCRRTD